jgi:tight adherence protein B
VTRRRTRAAAALVAAALVAAGVAAASAPGATASSRARLSEATSSHFPDMAYVLSLPAKQRLNASQVAVTENGAPVRDLTVAKPGTGSVGVVLVVDASDSMQGEPIVGAMAAARALAARRSAGQRIGLITFNNQSNIALPLTEDPAAITTALARQPALAVGTHIYDALEAARTMLKDAGVAAGSIVLLSDGKDVGSKATQATAIAGLKDTRVRVFAVGLRSPQYDPAALQAVAAQTSGTYTEAASAAALTSVYSALGYTLSNEYLVRYRSLAGPAEKIVVAARVNGLAGTARTTYVTPALPSAATPPGKSLWDKIIRSPITLLVVVLCTAGLLGYALFRVIYRPDKDLTRRIGQFVTLPADEKSAQRQAEALVTEVGERPPDGGDGLWSRLGRFEEDMEVAGITRSLGNVAVLTAVGGLILGIVVSILVGSPAGLLAIFAAPFVTRWIVNRRLRSVRRTFGDQLPDNLDVISSGLRAGHTFIGSLAVCVDDAVEPSKTEFRRVIADEQLGIPVEESLDTIGRRMKNRDVVQVALVARLQREAGTNAAEVLDQVAYNVRERLELRRLITALTAQGRMARWIVSLLPVALFVAIYLLNRDYLSPLWTDSIGVVAMIVAAIMVVIGSLIIKRIVNIEV